ncbi:MAG: L,D-transpeptidase family protein [Mariprofundaceae bacterium]|nr:L,D-transpeptidase family protein [Mariprofundaceae bacterium]
MRTYLSFFFSFILSSSLLFAGLAHAVEIPAGELDRLSQALHENTADPVKLLSSEEKLILEATLSLQGKHLKQTLKLVEQAKQPDPLLAVIKAEAYRQLAIQAVAQAGSYGQILQQQRVRLEAVDLSSGLAEAQTRLGALAEKLDGRRGLPRDVLQLGESTRNIFIVDKSRSRLSIYSMNPQGKLVRNTDEYVVTGTIDGDKQIKGDKRTPNGVYRFVQRLNDPALHARYGPVAFPIDYPNALDALHHKTGSGIWMHGYRQNISRRAPQDTLGCFALPNKRLLEVAKDVHIHHSWVLIGEEIVYGDDDARIALRDSVKSSVASWAKAWSSRDHAHYIDHYDTHFKHKKFNLKGWSRYKKRVNGNKSYIRVKLSDMTLIHDPHRWAEGEVVVAEFAQNYESSNLNSTGRKRLYLTRPDAKSPWKILIEESVPAHG